MSCFHPIKAWMPSKPYLMLSGGKSVIFSDPHDDRFKEISIPCGQCIGCRERRSHEWALRCMHEASLHDENCFLTLTYKVNPVSLNKEDITLFFKKLRKFLKGKKVRYFQCGEYGNDNDRPHHHVLLFGYDFPDKEWIAPAVGGAIYGSKTLEKLWSHGFVSIGDLTFDSAAYVARYCMKKITGDLAKRHYGDRLPEYATMSLKPGIGYGWLNKYEGDVYPKDFVTYETGLKMKPPRYYDKMFNRHHRRGLLDLKERRLDRVSKRVALGEFSPERLAVKEEIKRIALKKLERRFER